MVFTKPGPRRIFGKNGQVIKISPPVVLIAWPFSIENPSKDKNECASIRECKDARKGLNEYSKPFQGVDIYLALFPEKKNSLVPEEKKETTPFLIE